MGDGMKEKQGQFIFTFVFSVVVIISIYIFYPVFEFHTYDEVVYEEFVVEEKNEDFELINYEYFVNEAIHHIGGGTFTIINTEWLEEKELNITIYNDSREIFNQMIEVKEEVITYTLDNIEMYEKMYDPLEVLLITIENEEEVLFEGELSFIEPVEITANTKEYRIENVYILPSFMRLGKLNIVDDISEYTDIALEYRYVSEDDYEVFYKVIASIEEYEAMIYDPLYYASEEDGNLTEKQMSIVVILSNEEEEYVFSIDLGDEE